MTITTSKDGFCDKSDAEIWTAWKIGFARRDFKREAWKIDSCFCFVSGCQYVAAVDLLDETKYEKSSRLTMLVFRFES